MFAPQNKAFATILLFGVMICWGAWVPLRIKSKTEAPVFVILYVLSQWCTILFLSLSLGMVTNVGNIFDSSTFIGALINTPGNIYHIFYIVAAGFLNANGDFLCASACAKLPASVANPIYGGLALVVGSLLNFFVEEFEGNLPALVGGVLAALAGIFSLTLSDHYASHISTRRLSRYSVVSSRHSLPDNASLYESLQPEEGAHSRDSHGQYTAWLLRAYDGMNKWVFVCVLAGVVCGSWSPLVVLGTEGKHHVDNPYILMIFFQSGQVVAIPFMIWYYTHFEMTTLPQDFKSRSLNGLFNCIAEITHYTSKVDIVYACITGVVVGAGFFFYFTAADVIPSTISFAISNCAPLITIAIDVCFNGHLKEASCKQTGFMALASVLFAAGVALLVIANS